MRNREALEDFITNFFNHLKTNNELSNDWYDNNA